ncbi:MAG: AAA family ATPase [Candidatus Izemoplasmatales bacterium]|nr:AAA family ATPase [bacterium]MDZ4197629.1 AAA family ATPase [Candidatus Izemoplasmatales bacterium]
MSDIKRIHIFGAAGSGSSTLARAISEEYHYHHIEVDDAMFEPSDPPFLKRRTEKETRDILIKELKSHEYSVLSGAIVGFGDCLKDSMDLFIFIHIPVEIRIERIKQREIRRFGSRVLVGGDMYQQHMDFLAWVKAYETGDETVRSLVQHRNWLLDVLKPVIEIDSVKTIKELMEEIRPYVKKRGLL